MLHTTLLPHIWPAHKRHKRSCISSKHINLKTLDTIGNCQRPVLSLSLGVSQHKLEKLLGWRYVLEQLFSSCQNMCGVFRIRSTTARSVRCTALKKTSDRTTIALASLTFAAHNRPYLGSAGNACNLTSSLDVLLHPAATRLVGIAGKMLFFLETYKLTVWTTQSHMYFARVFTLCIARNVCLN